MKNKIFNHLFRLVLACLTAMPAITHAQPGGWSVDPAAYQYSMTVVAQIQVGGVPNHLPDNHLAVFSHGQIRGYAAPLSVGGQAYYFLNLYSNQYKNDTLYFRAFLGADGKVYESTDTLVFRHHLELGTIGEPVQVHLFLGNGPLIYTLPEVSYPEPSCPQILNVEASDNLNSEGNGLTYSINGGADAAKFAIDPQTGLLSWFNFTPHLADPADANGDNRYEVDVKVTDGGGLFDVQHITVTVVSAAPPPPLVCPPNLTLNTSTNGTGDCGATTDQTAIALPNACAESSLLYEIHGATTASGNGLIPASQVFSTGSSTAIYLRSGNGGGECAFSITVLDDEPPGITCPASLTVTPNVFSPCGAVATGIDALYADNCAAPALGYLLSGAGSGTGSGQASGLMFPVGTSTVAYTVTDGAGATSTCSFQITVPDCNTAFSGTIRWETDGVSGVQNATVSLTGSAAGSAVTNAAGFFQITLPYQTGSFTLKPAKNINKLNGVTSADAQAIQQHIANPTLLPAPFKRIAADVNKSNSITTLDVTLINQALLGNQSALNQMTSWRFVPSSYVFPNPSAPWGFPEQFVLNGGGNFANQDFKGVKLGDVVVTWANPANFGAGHPLTLRVQDQTLQAGQFLDLEFRANLMEDLASFQLALHFDPGQLRLVDIETDDSALMLTLENFGTYNLDAGEIRTVWTPVQSKQVSESSSLFHLKMAVLESGALLSEVLRLDEDVLPARAYNSVFEESGVELQFVESTGAGQPAPDAGLALRLAPNPFAGHTVLGFTLPADTDAEIRVSDIAGRLLWSEKAAYTAGQHRQNLFLDGASGVMIVELITPQDRLTQRLIARQ